MVNSLMDHQLLDAALRVLSGSAYGTRIAPSDIDVVQSNALPEECHLNLDDLARHVAERAMRKGPTP